MISKRPQADWISFFKDGSKLLLQRRGLPTEYGYYLQTGEGDWIKWESFESHCLAGLAFLMDPDQVELEEFSSFNPPDGYRPYNDIVE